MHLGSEILKKSAIFALLSVAHIFAFASSNIDKSMMCDLSSKSFFEQLTQNNLIELKPYSVTKFISHFHTTASKSKLRFSKKRSHEDEITAFGMHVDSVFGYADGQILFTQDPDRQTPDVYGVVVIESIANVQAQLHSVGAEKARTRRLDASKTIIVCQGV